VYFLYAVFFALHLLLHLIFLNSVFLSLDDCFFSLKCSDSLYPDILEIAEVSMNYSLVFLLSPDDCLFCLKCSDSLYSAIFEIVEVSTYCLYSEHNSVLSHIYLIHNLVLKSYVTRSYSGFKLVCLLEVAGVVLLLGCSFTRL
jgi:hypothetical protein